MLPLHKLTLALSAVLLVLINAQGQDDPEREFRNKRAAVSSVEDKVAKRIAQEWAKEPETVRLEWTKAMKSAFPEQAGAGITEAEREQWFVLLSNGGPEWRLDTGPKQTREIHVRATERMGLPKGTAITREQYVGFSREFLRPDSTAPFKPEEVDPNIAAEKMFKSFDVDQNGILTGAELSDKLAEVADRADANRDGRIDVNEYKAFFANRVQQESIELREKEREKQLKAEGKLPKDAPVNNKDAKDGKADGALVVIRAGNLPAGLPSWFEKLDTDNDGQVGLYEWRAAERNVDDFVAMDLNGDGLLTAEEFLRYARMNNLDAKKVDAKASPTALLQSKQGKSQRGFGPPPKKGM